MYLDEESQRRLSLKSLGANCQISTSVKFYRPESIVIGENCRIDDDCILVGNIHIGKNCHIASKTILSGGRKKGVFLHDDTTIAYNCTIISRSNDYSGKFPAGLHAIEENELELEANTILGKNVILGIGVTVLPGVHIKEGCAIGAHTLVNHNTNEWGIYIGTPARRIKDRLCRISNNAQKT